MRHYERLVNNAKKSAALSYLLANIFCNTLKFSHKLFTTFLESPCFGVPQNIYGYRGGDSEDNFLCKVAYGSLSIRFFGDRVHDKTLW